MRELLKKGRFVAYCGYEPSGKIHFGHFLTIRKLMDLQRAGARCIVLLADLHAYLNHKGTLEDIRMVAEYNKHCFIALGLDARRTEFLLGSSFQFDPDFIIDVLRMATETTLLRARRSMAEIARRADDPDAVSYTHLTLPTKA